MVPELLRAKHEILSLGCDVQCWKCLAIVHGVVELIIVPNDEFVRHGVAKDAGELQCDGMRFILKLIASILKVDVGGCLTARGSVIINSVEVVVSCSELVVLAQVVVEP